MSMHSYVDSSLARWAPVIIGAVVTPLALAALGLLTRGRLGPSPTASASLAPRGESESQVGSSRSRTRRRIAAKVREVGQAMNELRLVWALAVALATRQTIRWRERDVQARAAQQVRRKRRKRPTANVVSSKKEVDLEEKVSRHPALQKDAEVWFDTGAQKILTIARHQGVYRAARVMKDFASEMRAAWIGNRVPKHFLLKGKPHWVPPVRAAAALSFLGRALPEGQMRESDKARKDFALRLSSEFVSRPDDLESIQDYARRWAQRYLPRHPDSSQTTRLVTSSSASFLYPRSSGGISRELLDELDAGSASFPDLPKPSVVPWSVWSAVCAELRQLKAASDKVAGLPPPRGRLSIVRQRGLKTRAVTAMTPEHLVFGHMARRRLFKGLRRWELTRDVIAGRDRDAVNSLRGAVGKVISSDLTAASDLIPRDVARALVRGLSESGRFTPEELLGLEFGSMDPILSTDVEGFEEFPGRRGILMGFPTTWSLLCLYHGWAWNQAVDYSRSCRILDGPLKGTRPKVRARICGDDLIGVALPKALSAYEDALVRTGAQFSEGKHFLSSDRGVFLEKLWEFRGVPVEVTDQPVPIYRKLRGAQKRKRKTLVRVDSYKSIHINDVSRCFAGFSLQAFVSASSDTGLRTEYGPPSWMTQAFAESSLLEEGVRWQHVACVGRTLDPSLPERFQRGGIPPYLPRFLGGAGLAGPPSASKFHRRALSSLLFGQGRSLRPDYSFERCWAASNPTQDRAAAELLDCLAVGKVLNADEPSPRGYACVGRVDDIYARALAFGRSTEDFFLGKYASRMVYPSFGRLCARVKGLRETLAGLWRSAHPVKLNVPVLAKKWKERKTFWLHMPLQFVDPATRRPPPGYSPVELSEFIWLSNSGLRDSTRGLAIRGLPGLVTRPGT